MCNDLAIICNYTLSSGSEQRVDRPCTDGVGGKVARHRDFTWSHLHGGHRRE